jgi:hypothetical protein
MMSLPNSQGHHPHTPHLNLVDVGHTLAQVQHCLLVVFSLGLAARLARLPAAVMLALTHTRTAEGAQQGNIRQMRVTGLHADGTHTPPPASRHYNSSQHSSNSTQHTRATNTVQRLQKPWKAHTMLPVTSVLRFRMQFLCVVSFGSKASPGPREQCQSGTACYSKGKVVGCSMIKDC